MHPDSSPDYKKIYAFVRSRFEKTKHFCHGPFDETYFTLRVYESAKEILSKIKEKADKEIILTACLLHDIGKTKLKPSRLFCRHGFLEDHSEEWHRHAKLSIPIAKRFLRSLGHSEQFIEQVSYLIENHDLRHLKQKSLELQILQDADLIADIGFAGFIRPFLFCGKFNRQSIIGSINYIKTEDRIKGGEKLNLKVSKEIGKREMQIQKNLVAEISKDIKSDLL